MSISATKLCQASYEAIKNRHLCGEALKNPNKIMKINKNIKNDKLPFACAVIFFFFYPSNINRSSFLLLSVEKPLFR